MMVPPRTGAGAGAESEMHGASLRTGGPPAQSPPTSDLRTAEWFSCSPAHTHSHSPGSDRVFSALPGGEDGLFKCHTNGNVSSLHDVFPRIKKEKGSAERLRVR